MLLVNFCTKKFLARGALGRFDTKVVRVELTLFSGIVGSTLLYPIIPLHAQTSSQLLQLERVQNRALRKVYNISLADRIFHKQFTNKTI